jgi:DNA polymerase-3 subunit delta'
MPIVDIYGHESLRLRLAKSVASQTLPGSILLHGPRGAGKQRLAIWLAQTLLCSHDNPPCGDCQGCRYTLELAHPDLHWIFPRPRLKAAESDLDEVRDDYAEATAARAADNGLYPAPSGSEGIFITVVRVLVKEASLSPALAKRKVFIVGDADRMVAQEGAEFAANAFLKLLEEPPADTTIILTSSEPGALLPTIKSRVVGVRVGPLADAEVKAFIEDPVVKAFLDKIDKSSTNDRIRQAAGTPGKLLEGEQEARSVIAARKILDSALGTRASVAHSTALSQGAANARGQFSDTLDALVTLLCERMRESLHQGDPASASAASRAVDAALKAKQLASGNVSPQLITSRLIREISAIVR